MNRELLLAILAMDSYNRGYGVGITGLNESGLLGDTAIREPGEGEQEGWEESSFYAIAYNVSGVKDADGDPLFGADATVISYRGTDSPLSDFFAFGIGAGQPFSLTGGLTDQARLTIGFYNAVAGEGAASFTANITTTGHFLGGGLAGLTAANDNEPLRREQAA